MSNPTAEVPVYDLAIIGSGSGNSIPDDRFNDWSIAMFESGTYGGTCLNVGCIPTKMFVYPAELAALTHESSKVGVDMDVTAVHWPQIRDRVFGRIDPISEGGKRYRTDECANITVYSSHVRFTGDEHDGGYVLRTDDGQQVVARRVIVAAGSRPVIPPVIAESGVRYYTNEDIMRLDQLPRHLIVVGSGFIAAEFAHVFGALGSKVTVVARSGALLRSQDESISQRFTEIATQTWDVQLNRAISAVSTDADGTITVTFDDGSTVSGDTLLVAVGRRPNGDRLDAETVGITVGEDGRLGVDEFGRTDARGVWALGDVSSPYQLKHVANHEGRVVQSNVLGDWDNPTTTFDHRYVPSAVFTHPQIGSVGLTEAQARAAGIDVAVKVQNFGDVAYGWAMEDTTGICKLIADRATGKLVGAHILGPQAPSLVQTAITAMSFDIGVKELARHQYWIHPAMPEVFENALLGLDL